MKQQKRHQTHLISNIIIIVTVAVLIFLVVVLINLEKLNVRFETLVNWLNKLEEAVINLNSHTEILICIFALYIAKCQLPIPMGFLCMISGAIFPSYEAIAVNAVFISFFFIVKFVEGRWIGGGWAGMILNIRQMRFIRDWIQFRGNGNPYVLAVSRLVPSIPLGMVSKYYGSMHYDFIYYLFLSLLGFAPRLVIYTKIGSVLYNPFSVQFIVLLITVVSFTGISMLIFNIFYGIRSRQMNQTLLIYSEKEKYKIVL